jgi:hypothetical protein
MLPAGHPLDGRELRLECLRLAVGGANRATAGSGPETPEQITKRAQAYLDFVIAKPKRVGYEFGAGALIGQGNPESAAPDDGALRK